MCQINTEAFTSERSVETLNNFPFAWINQIFGLPTSSVARSFSDFVDRTRELTQPGSPARVFLTISETGTGGDFKSYRPVVTARSKLWDGSAITFAVELGEPYSHKERESDVKSTCVAAHALLILKRELEAELPGALFETGPSNALADRKILAELAAESKRVGVSSDQVERLLIPWKESESRGYVRLVMGWLSGKWSS
jgi:hypothetical protein